MPREHRPPNRRQLILDAALEAFAAHGYDGASYADLADKLEVTKAALYYHFPAKDDLLHALVGPLLDRLDAALAAHPARPPWPDGTRALLSDYLDALLVSEPLSMWVDRDTVVHTHPVLGERLRANNRRMRVALLGDATGGEPGDDTSSDADEESMVRAAAALGGLWRPVRQLHEFVDVAAHREALLDAAMAACLPLMGTHDRAGDRAGNGPGDPGTGRATDGMGNGPGNGAASRPTGRRQGSADRRRGRDRA